MPSPTFSEMFLARASSLITERDIGRITAEVFSDKLMSLSEELFDIGAAENMINEGDYLSLNAALKAAYQTKNRRI
jgi:hypothetical protein